MPLADTLYPDPDTRPHLPRLRKRMCSWCGAYSPSGTRGPGRLVKVWGGYRRELGPWLCVQHSRAVWGAYLARVYHRQAVIEASRRAGWPLSETQYLAWLVRERGVQLELGGVAA